MLSGKGVTATEEKKKTLLVITAIITGIIFISMGVSFALVGSNSSFSGVNVAEVIVSPVQKFFSKIGGGVGGFFEFIGDMRGYKEENLELKETTEQQAQKIRELESYQQENQRLRALLELKENNADKDMIGCEVIAKEPGNWFDVFTVDKGENYGIKKNDVVITNNGLAGRVTEVGSTWAKVVAIIDTDSSVGALVSRTQDIAIVDGDMTLADRGQCKLNAITSAASLVVGDEVETSGLGGIYPKGLLIGTVSEIKSDPSGYTQYAVIDTAVDFERLREVLVIRMPSEEMEE